ncbi:MAG: hypothetical protein OEY07_15555 [Gammaproteobacteria bacterium]|nr:hypothetical protein [Gammaproteobacteria bacterium]
MKIFLAVIVTCLVITLGAGCSKEPTFDATSDDTIKSSVQQMMANMSDAEKKNFQETFQGLLFLAAMANLNKNKSEEAMKKEIFSAFHGKTASEIMKLAEDFQKEVKKKMGK